MFSFPGIPGKNGPRTVPRAMYLVLNRRSQEGVHLPSSTIGEWPKAVAQALEPLYERLKQQVLESGYLLAPYPVLHLEKTDSKHRRRSHRGYAWTYYAPELKGVGFDCRPGRGRDGPEQMLAGPCRRTDIRCTTIGTRWNR